MPRRSFFVALQACLALAGCGGGSELTASNASVAPTGAPPLAQTASVSIPEDGQSSAVLRATDVDGDALTFSIADPPAHATVTLDPASGVFTLRPHANFHGADAFVFAVTDGYGNVSHARVNVTVEPLNDAPVIDAATASAVVAAGRAVQLEVGASDVDGDRITKSVSQAGGAPLLNLEWGPQGVRFDSPNVRSATTMELLLRVTDDAGLTSHTSLTVTVSPISRSGKLFTVLGSPQSNGLHWIITGDGFTVTEQQDLLQAGLAMARKLTDAPELSRHSSVWNVHVFTAVSRTSGIPGQRNPRVSITAFDASLGCTDVERVACVNWDKVYSALLSERVAFDEVAVILNTDLYVGSASSSGLLVSRHRDAEAVVLHEMGHLLAGLADEYVDHAVANKSREYVEGRYPNVTRATDPGLIPWRHWFADAARIPVDPGETGIGRFEGAYYMPSGFYRPKRDSFMRNLDAPIGEVNAEAWLRALYRAVPPLLTASPAHRAVMGLPGETLAFEIVSAWPAETMAVRWRVDGAEVEGARDAWRYVFQADGLTHEIRVSIEDRTGLIRAPEATEHSGGVTWMVSGDPSIDVYKANPPIDRIGGWIRMRVDSAGHSVMGISNTEARSPRRVGTSAEVGFELTLFDAYGALISRQRVADPRVVQGPMPPSGEPPAGHGMAMLESGYYLLAIPEGADARKVRIREVDETKEKAGAESMDDVPASIEQWLVL